MTRSIFDPANPNAEHSGSRNLGPMAQDISHLPPEIAEGQVDTDEDAPDTSPELKEIADNEHQSADIGKTMPAD